MRRITLGRVVLAKRTATLLSSVEVVNGKYFSECVVCGWYFLTKKSHLKRRKTCSTACSGFRKKSMYAGKRNPNYGNRGESNPIYKGGTITNYGYKKVKAHEHPNADKFGYIFEHRLIMSKHLGRPLLSSEHIHHKDGNKLNNDISNLEIITLEEHSRLHSLLNPQPRCEVTGIFLSRMEEAN